MMILSICVLALSGLAWYSLFFGLGFSEYLDEDRKSARCAWFIASAGLLPVFFAFWLAATQL
jgi:hypothetical protein